MKPIEFPGMNFTFNPAKGTEDRVQPLPCYRDKLQTISCWELSDEEIDWIIKNRKIWLSIWNGADPLQPQLPIAHDIEFPSSYFQCDVWYKPEKSLRSVKVYVQDNIEIPQAINYTFPGEEPIMLFFDSSRALQKQPNKALNIDDLYFRKATFEEGVRRADKVIAEYEGSEIFKVHSSRQRNEMVLKIKENCLQFPLLCRKLQAGKEEILF